MLLSEAAVTIVDRFRVTLVVGAVFALSGVFSTPAHAGAARSRSACRAGEANRARDCSPPLRHSATRSVSRSPRSLPTHGIPPAADGDGPIRERAPNVWRS